MGRVKDTFKSLPLFKQVEICEIKKFTNLFFFFFEEK